MIPFWSNKTAGYHRHILCPPILLKLPFKKDEKHIFKQIL